MIATDRFIPFDSQNQPTQTFWRVKEIDKSFCQCACSHSYMYSCCKPLLGCEALGNLVLGILLNRIIKGLSMYWTHVSTCFQCMNSFQPWFNSCRFILENTFDGTFMVLRLLTSQFLNIGSDLICQFFSKYRSL